LKRNSILKLNPPKEVLATCRPAPRHWFK